MVKQFVNTHLVLAGLLLALVAGLMVAVTGTALANNRAQRSEAPVYWSWDFMDGNTSNPAGTSTLVRSANGISANYRSEGLRPDNAMTLWFIVFNYPDLCTPDQGGCSPDDLGSAAAAQGDFLVASGNVIGASGIGNFGGHLNVGDASGSGLAEMLCPETMDCTPGLLNLDGALVVLAIHDHGPRPTGQTLQEQLSSFLGGCVGAFNGNEFGFATGPEDIPDADGECSTIQFSPHPPND